LLSLIQRQQLTKDAEISRKGAAPTRQQIKTYSTKLDKLVAKLRRYGDAESVAELEKFKERLQDLLSGLGLDVGECNKTSEHFPSRLDTFVGC
jgi:hypothetical protein